MSLGFGARAKSIISIIDFTGGISGSSSNSSGSGNAVVPSKPTVTVESHPENPTPDQFELYMPWIFAQWQCMALVAIAKRKQETYIPASHVKKKIEIKIKSTTSKVLGIADASSHYSKSKLAVLVKTSHIVKRSEELRKETEKYLKDTIPIEAFYDPLDHLVKLSIIDSPLKLPVELTRAFHICLPCQPYLNVLYIINSKLTPIVVCDLSTLLPHCNLTEVILDDNYIKEGNYYCLLDEASNLKYLSLKRCRINDAIVSKIIKRLVRGRPAEKHFSMLDLTSNNVTDVGAKLFGELLRRNRRITYLNLSGNMITDEGALSLLKYLKEFPLNDSDIIELKQRRMKYHQMRMRAYENILIEQIRRRQSERLIRKSIVRGKGSSQLQAQKPLSEAMKERLDEVVGPFVDLYDDNHIIFRDGKYYCTGNFHLAWLNLAYNNISYVTVKELTNVLHYQCTQHKYGDTGLLRIFIEGNYLPIRCVEYDLINLYLNRSLVENVPLTGKKQFGSILSKRATK